MSWIAEPVSAALGFCLAPTAGLLIGILALYKLETTHNVCLPCRPRRRTGRKARAVNRHCVIRAEKLRLLKLRPCIRCDRHIIRPHNPKDE